MSDSGARYYGDWAAKPGGYRENKANCVAEIALKWTVRYAQCSRPRGKGPGGLYCGVHARQLALGKRVKVPEER